MDFYATGGSYHIYYDFVEAVRDEGMPSGSWTTSTEASPVTSSRVRLAMVWRWWRTSILTCTGRPMAAPMSSRKYIFNKVGAPITEEIGEVRPGETWAAGYPQTRQLSTARAVARSFCRKRSIESCP